MNGILIAQEANTNDDVTVGQLLFVVQPNENAMNTTNSHKNQHTPVSNDEVTEGYKHY